MVRTLLTIVGFAIALGAQWVIVKTIWAFGQGLLKRSSRIPDAWIFFGLAVIHAAVWAVRGDSVLFVLSMIVLFVALIWLLPVREKPAPKEAQDDSK